LEISLLQQLFESHKNISVVNDLLKKQDNIHVKGLQGSSSALFAYSVFKKHDKHFLYILDDAENAGYFYHDLIQVSQSDNILFFPSAYKRAIKYGQIDSANEILRTEVLSKLQSGSQPLIIVSYPEALAEKVVSKETLAENTLQISVNEKIDTSFVSEVLDSYGFEYTDYVYEPGQYAIRGSILDVFSFSCEYPYRIDFFGDEVETIRTFDVESQLSKEKLKYIQIIPEMRASGLLDNSLLNLLPASSIVAYKDLSLIEGRLSYIYNDNPLLDNPEYETDIQTKLVEDKLFLKQLMGFVNLQFGTKAYGTPKACVEFDTGLQPVFHKNFDLISETLHEYLDKGYTIYILSDSEKQNKRIQSIFEDRGDDIPFTPVNKTLHEGFSDATLKICCFTDHQIFDRFHKYNLKSE